MTDLVVNFTMTTYTVIPTPPPQNGTNAYYQFHHVQNGWIPSVQDIGERFRRLGQASTGLQSLGTVGAQVSIPMQAAFATDVDALNFAAACEGLADQVVAVKDAWKRYLPRVRVTNPTAKPVRMFGGTVAGGLPVIALVYCQFTFERLTDS